MKLNFFFYSKTSKQRRTVAREGFIDSINSLIAWSNRGEPGALINLAFDSCALMAVVNDDRPDTAAKLSDHDRANVGQIVGGDGSNYGAHVLRLIKKADAFQREVLRMVYPDHVAALEDWERTPLKQSAADDAEMR